MGEDKKTLTIFSTLAKNSVKFFHKTASQGLFRCFLPLPRPLPQPPRHAVRKRNNADYCFTVSQRSLTGDLGSVYKKNFDFFLSCNYTSF